MNVEISELPRTAVNVDEVSRFAVSVLEREGVPADAHLSISFVDLDRMAELNLEHMGKSGPTDVLSFPIEDAVPGRPPAQVPEGPPLALGDIVLSEDVVAEHAETFDATFEDELYLMICHGVLHILGWDHQTETEAHAMESREAEHLATIGKVRR